MNLHSLEENKGLSKKKMEAPPKNIDNNAVKNSEASWAKQGYETINVFDTSSDRKNVCWHSGEILHAGWFSHSRVIEKRIENSFIRIGGSSSKIFEDEMTRIIGDMSKVQRGDRNVTLEVRDLHHFIQEQEVQQVLNEVFKSDGSRLQQARYEARGCSYWPRRGGITVKIG